MSLATTLSMLDEIKTMNLVDPGPREELDYLLTDLRSFVRRYVVLAESQLTTVVLWIAHTWGIDAFDVTPYVAAMSAEPRSGKSRLQEVTELLVKKPWRVTQPSEAVLFRKIGASHPTLLFDEVDTVFGSRVSDSQEGVRAILNAGFQRGVTVPRCLGRGETLEDFEVFCPKFLAGIGTLPPTVRDRSFLIRMKRKKRSERVERFRRRDAEPTAAGLRARLERWADESIDILRDARPELPDELGDRAQDAGEPLLAIAEMARGTWPHSARRALVSLSGEKEAEDDTIGVQLLTDIKRCLDLRLKTGGVFATVDLIRDLLDPDDSPWKRHVLARDPLDAVALSKLLRPFGIRPKLCRDRSEPFRGYHVSEFLDAFERYLPLPPDSPSDGTPPVAPCYAVTNLCQSGSNRNGVPVTPPVTLAETGEETEEEPLDLFGEGEFAVTGSVTGGALRLAPLPERVVTGQRAVTGGSQEQEDGLEGEVAPTAEGMAVPNNGTGFDPDDPDDGPDPNEDALPIGQESSS